MIKNFVVSDIHSFFTEWMKALKDAGYEENNPDHRIIICGDLLDRGSQSRECLDFVKKLAEANRVIYIRGNHEDLLYQAYKDVKMGAEFIGSHHVSNGTIKTIADLTGVGFYNIIGGFAGDDIDKLKEDLEFISAITYDYYEVDNYIFVHGWIPSETEKMPPWYRHQRTYHYMPEWREASDDAWNQARWVNGMELAYVHNIVEPDKIIVCGHWHTSYAWSNVRNACTEFGDDAIFDTFIDESKGIIALDACTARTRKVNCLVIETSC